MTDPTPREMAQALAARRRRATFVCEVCGQSFEGLDRPKQQPRFCSTRCRVRAFRAAQKPAAS